MSDRIEKHGLKVSPALYSFIEKEALPGSGVDPDRFWAGFAALAVKLMPQNRALLAERDRLQAATVFSCRRTRSSASLAVSRRSRTAGMDSRVRAARYSSDMITTSASQSPPTAKGAAVELQR